MSRDNLNNFLANANVPEHDTPTFAIGRKSGPKGKATFGSTVHLTSKQAKARVNRSLVSASTVLAERGDMKPRKSPRLETQAIAMAANAKRLNAEIDKLRKRMTQAGSDIPLAMLQQLGRKVHKRDILVSRLHSVLTELEKQERTLHVGLTDSHGAPIKRAYGAAPMPSD